MSILALVIDDVVTTKFNLDKPKMMIGRLSKCEIQITDNAISGEHALIEVEANEHLPGAVDVFISDCDSTNGTFVNDEPVKKRQRLNNNDVVRVAWNSFQFIEEQAEDLERTVYTLD